ncbi:MAG: hypothetical protein UU82_C0006G0019 [Candidatus Nomurabacteria bacterium GW2011_GWC2_41_8]|uniref:Uncharacterized protein n=2 Tax=Candidatus Nomuraibacteriota TaxID=1752729 RepID=A0A1F6YCZ5_9BACT|nr:MAG: hypothetical protein UU82_C0006G0019 [Candidatus Nomurabacteria bacterium GW2011_GWC2_41_8]OGI67464.1 MAG: hypothetical protein A2823_01070 [Candidatus Nomurabacteria bacterium RIFCSPHIGHO2_01_FULL_41_91]OGI80525.1 MAG: hypothetical protein A3D43_02765 [Candidatus Nomurabacteria bacterium RIFCSPHIGHO2_02_FULL_41_52]OGI84695.1 MAG: hypothetical protein A3F49_02470 [Candidatus Nomurabacteria bacterium RIFCSPHIGHO2_12_FULL_42_19]OGI93824.1 MAG: hypothetical protein A3A07_01350 [Candidatus 
MIDVVIFWAYKILIGLLPVAGVIALGWVAWKFWVHYIQQDFISGIDFVLLEIVPPRDVLRSPKAMELFITNALYHWSMKGGKEEYWQGAVWFWFSLEIASIDGQVHFYIRTPTRIRGLIETQMYAQYPQAQVKAVEDYTLGVDEITPKGAWNGWGCEFKLTKPEAFPIRTYVDYGLDKDPDEEVKVDPISPVVEFFGSLGKGEQAWMQIIVTPSKKVYRTKGTLFGYHDWVRESRLQVEKFLKPFTRFHPDPTEPGRYAKEIRVPGFLDATMKAMSAKTSKLGFDTGVRLMYVAKKEIYPPGSRTNNSRDIRLVLRQYAKPDCNEFYRINSAQGDALNSSILTLSRFQVMTLANRMLHEYRERAFFHLPLRHHIFSVHIFEAIFPKPIIHAIFMTMIKPFFLPYVHHKTFVLNTEELATMWHFPGQILKVPTLERIESKEASPPSNLPT